MPVSTACIFTGKLKANKGWGALHLASYFGHTAVVKFLIEVSSSACSASCHFGNVLKCRQQSLTNTYILRMLDLVHKFELCMLCSKIRI